MISLQRSNHTTSSPRQQSKSRNYFYDPQQDEDYLVPDMIESPQGSTETMSSGEFHTPTKTFSSPPRFSSSSRMQERFSETLNPRTHRRRSRSRRRNELEPSNSSILAGANIIKSQLSGDSPIRATQHSEPPPPTTSQSWDPYQSQKMTLRGRIQDYHKGKDLFESKKSSRDRKQEILSQGDNYFQTRDSFMVKRLTESDDSTFASSKSGNGGYLPNALLNGFSCGGLNHTIGNCSTPQEFVPMRAPTCNTIQDELETSTLDFLANLHPNEQDWKNPGLSDLERPFDGQVHPATQPAEGQLHPASQQLKEVSSSSFVTAAATPFEKMLSARSTLHAKLETDQAYTHALQAGTLWQSLCSQHVRFPAHWWDGQTPVGPPLGSITKRPWSYLGRHRVQGDAKLMKLIGNRSSSGRILLHLIVRDEISGQPIEDIACGCFHPNARGVRTSQNYDPRIEDCRDVWIAHRRRAKDSEEDYFREYNKSADEVTTLESLLRHQNKGRVHLSPLGAQGGKHSVTNENLRSVFGQKPPVFTVFCLESELYEVFQTKLDGSIPASVALLRHYLRFQMNR